MEGRNAEYYVPSFFFEKAGDKKKEQVVVGACEKHSFTMTATRKRKYVGLISSRLEYFWFC